ncbi:hypothetical protein [Frigoriglobus tundricola]|uniref:Uncharacterized protein n=1 Tax=Frigoriglobus tundricola TaxID=2774151 RepID=A0A6M5YJC2_9BACT|nr:hypothetical protein [Frigoriglobus tundricola]QJW94068.1 hypothetical protein FTUN_1587 [Frigoriglobus tundricola]
MRNLLALFGLLVLGFGGGGWYLGWYKLSVTRGIDGNLEIKTDVDTKKVTTDSSEALKNISAVVGNQVDKAAQEAKAVAPTSTPGATPGPVTPAQPSPANPTAQVAPTDSPAATDPTVPPAPPAAPKKEAGRIHLFPPK